MGKVYSLSRVHLRKRGPLNTRKDTERGAINRELSGLAPEPRWLCYDLVRVFPEQTWLNLLLRELRGQIDRSDHTVWARDAFAGDIEGGAVIGTGARERQAEGDVHCGMKGVQVQRNQALIMIQTESGVPFLVNEMEEESIRRDGPLENC